MRKSVLSLTILLLVNIGVTKAQYDNSAFFQKMDIDTTDYSNLYLGVNTLLFNKNNEYSDNVADGYTLFGYQINPYLSYYPAKFVRIDLGVYAQQDFGNPEFSMIVPTFSARLIHDKFSLQFGNIAGNIHHRMIEPLYDFENVLVNRPELGFQILYDGEKLWSDMWINWEKMLYSGDYDQEIVTGGSSSKFNITKNITIPVQLLINHQGGQIDTNPNRARTKSNFSIGVDYQKILSGFLREFRMEYHFIAYKDFSSRKLSIFDDGYGWYLNAAVKAKINTTVMLSYWMGSEYIPIKGTPLYSSVSFKYKYPNNLEQERELLILRFMSDYNIFEGMVLSSRFEPYINLRDGKFNFSMGLYLNYSPEFLLKSKIKAR